MNKRLLQLLVVTAFLGQTDLQASAPVATSTFPTNNPAKTTLNKPYNGILFASGANQPPFPALTFDVVTQPAHGTVALSNPTPQTNTSQATTTFTYTPITEYTGNDSFTFSVTNTISNQTSSPATVNILMQNPMPGANTPPSLTVRADSSVANPDSNNYSSNGFTLSGYDPIGNALTFNITQPTNGTVFPMAYGRSGSRNNNTYLAAGSFGNPAVTYANYGYNPKSGFTGTDSFTYTVTNTSGITSSPQKMNITIG